MVEPFMKISSLANLGLKARNSQVGPKNVKIMEVSYKGQICVRLDPSNKKILDLTEKALGLLLPIKANTTTRKGKKTALWLGPNEWLIITEQPENLHKKLTKMLKDHHVSVLIVTDSRTTISVSGKHARDVLKKGCGLDLHPNTFGPGDCAQTAFASTQVLIHQTSETKGTKYATYHISVNRSFAEYVWAWLEDAAQEYGVEYGSS